MKLYQKKKKKKKNNLKSSLHTLRNQSKTVNQSLHQVLFSTFRLQSIYFDNDSFGFFLQKEKARNKNINTHDIEQKSNYIIYSFIEWWTISQNKRSKKKMRILLKLFKYKTKQKNLP